MLVGTLAFTSMVLHSHCMFSLCQILFAICLVFPAAQGLAWKVIHVFHTGNLDLFSYNLCRNTVPKWRLRLEIARILV